MKKIFKILMGLIIGVGLMVAGGNTAYASPFFEFNKGSMPASGYADNLWLIVHSPGEFETSDIIWMIDNDCLDMNGAQWCYNAGLISKEDLSRPALLQAKTKVQTIYHNNDLIDYSKNPPQLLPAYQAVAPAESVPEAPVPEAPVEIVTETPAVEPEETVQPSQECAEVEPGETMEESEPAYEHYYDDLTAEAKAAYSYFKATGKDCFVHIKSNAENKDIEGAYLLSQTPEAGEIRFGTQDGKVLYSFIFKNLTIDKEDVLNLDVDLNRKESGNDNIEQYELSLGSAYPENVSLKILVDRKNQEYSVIDMEGNKVGDFRSDYSGYLEIPVTKNQYTISCEIPVESTVETAIEETEESQVSTEAEVSEEIPVEEASLNMNVIVIICIVLVAGIAGIIIFLRKRK